MASSLNSFVSFKIGVNCSFVDDQYLVKMTTRGTNATTFLRNDPAYLTISDSNPTTDLHTVFQFVRDEVIKDTQKKKKIDWDKQILLQVTSDLVTVSKPTAKITVRRAIAVEFDPNFIFVAGEHYEVILMESATKSTSSNPRGGNSCDWSSLFKRAEDIIIGKQTINLLSGKKLCNQFDSIIFFGTLNEKEAALKATIKLAASNIPNEARSNGNPSVIRFVSE